jgi:hypothetical protein
MNFSEDKMTPEQRSMYLNNALYKQTVDLFFRSVVPAFLEGLYARAHAYDEEVRKRMVEVSRISPESFERALDELSRKPPSGDPS